METLEGKILIGCLFSGIETNKVSPLTSISLSYREV